MIRNIDSLPRLAAGNHLTQRVAFALDSARSDSPEMVFDREAFQRRLLTTCLDHSLFLRDLIAGSPAPISSPWHRLRCFFA